MSVVAPLRPTPSTPMSWLLGACEWASRFGVYLLPVFYLAFFAALLMLWSEPHATVWLIAAASVLGWTMVLWALVFCFASLRSAPVDGLPRIGRDAANAS
jgi:cytochrome c biogenesis factor